MNWVGRTVLQVRQDAALFAAVQQHLAREWTMLTTQPAHQVHLRLRQLVWDDVAAGRLTLTPEAPTPLGWKLRTLAHRVGMPIVLLLASPVLVPLAVIGVLQLRRAEQTNPELCPRTPPAHVAALAAVEDFDVTNQFTRYGQPEAGAGAALGHRRAAVGHQLRRPSRVHQGPAGARAHDPLRALGVPRRQDAA